MEADLFKILRQVTGVGRIALGVALPLLRDVINSPLALRLGRVQAIRLLRLLTVLVWSMGVIGVPLWAIPTDRGATQLVARAGVGSAGQIERSRIEIRDVPGRGLPPRERNSTRTHIHVESGINGSAVIINAPPHSEASVSVIMSVSGRLLAIACRALTPAIIGLIMGITPAATRAGVSLEAFGGVAVGGDIRDSTITVGIPPEQIQNLISRRSESEVELRDLGAKLAVTEAAVSGFLHILEQQQVPRELLPAKLAEIALRHKQMVARREALQTADPKVRQLLSKAHTAITEGDYGGAETLLTSMQALRHPGK